jgi:carbon-monoxide dehydrogenase medium subunit
MKPARFTYHAPVTLTDALGLLAHYGDDAKILAGGQSLMPILNFRLARPANLIDANGIGDLAAVENGAANGGLVLGAMVRQRALERSALVCARCPLITQALPYVGHPQIRNRGTLGGSLAHADPAAELPAVMVALDASFTLRKSNGARVVKAEDFFLGQLSTVLEPDEMLVRIDIPASPEQTGSSLQEVAMRLGDFALGGVATTLSLGRAGTIARARIVCFGVGERPSRQTEAEQSLVGARPAADAFAEAGRIVAARVEPTGDIHASASYRKRLAGILTHRALAAAQTTLLAEALA